MLYGFRLVREQDLYELNGRARIWRYARTGTELLSIENDDENKAFGIVLRTPPPDATGLPHILEHSVLSGSRRYTCKSPLGQLLKGSLATYVNAFTFPDKTGYVFSSQNTRDLYNLADVFLDAVFYPLLRPQTFEQEAWHVELERLEGPLTLNGVVLNEQRGNFSSPARLIEHHSQMPLFPDTPYGVNRAGDPAEIPNLTHERLVAYHRTFYHPSNARIFFYGDDDPEERLRYLDTWLRAFERIEVDSAFPLQGGFDRPRRVTVPYDAGQGADREKGWVTLNWVVGEVGDPGEMLALEMLDHLLVGTPASPLRAALIDSELGEDLAGIGLFTHVRQMYFSTGLRGVDPAHVGLVETTIEETLRGLVEERLDPDLVAASLNTVGFQLREANYGRFPRGLALLWLRATTTWVHDGDPLALLAFEAPLQSIRDRVEKGERLFERLIREVLLDNPHRATVLLAPDAGVQGKGAERAWLEERRAAMSEDELRRLVEETAEFRRLQETPDPPEALAAIPSLALSDLSPESAQIPLQVLEVGGCETLYHDLFTNSILYLDLAFDLHTLPQELLPYAPLFGQALIEIGTEREGHAALAQRIGLKTAGLSSALLTSSAVGSPQAVGRLVLRGKATVSQADDLIEILREVLLTVRLDNRARFAQLVRQARAGIESGLLPNGSVVVGTRLGARYSESGWLAEQVSGIAQLSFLGQLAQEVEHNWPAILSRLEAVRRALIHRGATICNVTVDGAHWARLAPRLEAFLSSLPAGRDAVAPWTPQPLPAFEGLAVPTRVNYVAKGADLYALGFELRGSIAAIAHLIETAWLWERVRVRGGAYAGVCAFDRPSGLLTYLSYRDPNLLATIETYDRTAQFLRDLKLSEADRVKAIVGAIGRRDAYQLPDAKGYSSLARYLSGESDADRQRFREELLRTTASDFRAFAGVLERVSEQGSVVVMGSHEALSAANAARDDWLEVTKVL